MSKKKRLGRGLEALLGVGGSTSSDSESETKQTSDAGPKKESKFAISNDGVDVESVNDLLKDNSDSTDNAPVILPFKASEIPTRDLTKSTTSDDADPRNISLEKAREAAANSSASSNVGTNLSPTGVNDPQGKFKAAAPSDFAEALAANAKTSNDVTPSHVPSTESKEANLPGSANSPAPLPDRTKATKPKPMTVDDFSIRASDSESAPRMVELNVFDVDDNPFQPRREFNKSEIESLAESLKTHDQLQPILVRKVDGRYQLISGERRLRAAIHAGWSKINAQVREADDRLVAELAIVENLQRKDLNPIEKALSFRRYLDEHRCPQDELAGRLKIDRSTVANLLRLLELPQVVQKALQVGLVTNGHARALLPLGEEHLQIEFCNQIQREGLSVRATEQMVRDKIDQEDGAPSKSSKKSRTKSGQVLSLEKEFRTALGTKTEISASSRGRGKIVIHYTSKEEFERLRDYLVGTELDADAA